MYVYKYMYLYRCIYVHNFPRQGCYYRKMPNHLVTTIICTEKRSGEGWYHMETGQLICFAKGLAGFRMMLIFAGRYFRAEYIPIVFVLSVKLLSAMVIDVLSKTLIYCYYLVCN